MLNVFKSGFVLLPIIILSACLEVKDKSDDKVANALTEQNQILQQQANQVAETKTTISLMGVVNDAGTGVKAVNATVRIKIGSTVSEPVAATSGSFQIDNLAPDSDYELVLHSTANTFADRTYFGRTRGANSPGKIYQDLGVLTVAPGVEHKFKVLNSVTNAPITGLTFLANSAVGTGSGYEQYLHKSTYDASTQEYKITVPERLGVQVYANLDINSDGKVEYRNENDVNNSALNITDLNNTNPIYLIDLNANEKVKVRVSLLDAFLRPIPNAAINVNDSFNGSVKGTYDSATNQYVIDAVIDTGLVVMIPSFTSGGTNYMSSSVQIERAAGDEKYTAYIASSTSYTSGFSFNASAQKVFDVVVKPSLLTTSSNLGVIGASGVIDPASTLFKVFYTGAVDLKNDSVSLVKRGVIHVVKGNDSATDLILPGTTLIESVDEPVAVDAQQLLGKTYLSITPKAPLAPSYNYSFDVAGLTDLSNNLTVNAYGDAVDLYVPNTNVFSINDIKLDNNNFYTNGVIINPTNTAGVAANPYAGGAYVYLFLPTSIENLKTLTLRREQVTQNNVTTNSVETFNLVVNGSINIYKTNSVSLAENETRVGGLAAQTGAAVADGQWYYTGFYLFAQDNTAGNINSMTFTYSFETKAGVVETGTITLPVL